MTSMKPPAIMTNEMRLQAILDRKSSEGVLLQNVMELDSLSEDADFWISIVSDRSYSASHRRIATVQYFVRHMFYRKAWEINLSAMKLQPSECRPEVMRMVAGVVLVSHELDEVLLRVYFIFSEIDWLCVYLSLFPNAEDSLLLHAISGTKKNCSFVLWMSL